MTYYEIEDIVIKLHDIARVLEQNKKHWVFGNDLRKLADRLSRVSKNYSIDLTEHEKFAYDYARAISGITEEN